MEYKLISYACGDKHTKQQQKLKESAEQAGFTSTIEYGREDLDKDFAKKNYYILAQYHGAGLWLWKPYLLLHTLLQSKMGDVIFYMDSDHIFTKSAKQYYDTALEKGLVLFHENGREVNTCTATDTFYHMDALEDKYQKTTMLLATYLVCKVTEKTINFVREWLEWCKKPEVIFPMHTYETRPILTHCYDQSILTILAMRHNISPVLSPVLTGIACEQD